MPFSALVIGGETGTGKGLATRILHYSGRRAAGPLVEINCAALPRELLESELFGHEAGAFTGAKKRRRGLIEQASGGTLFLDEIAELELDLQAKLLKVIEDQRVRPLGSEQRGGGRRAAHRRQQPRPRRARARGHLPRATSTTACRCSAWRCRRCATRLEDLEDLVPADRRRVQRPRRQERARRSPTRCGRRCKAYDWPGNVRELRNVIERCVLFADGDVFPAAVAAAARAARAAPRRPQPTCRSTATG